MLTDRLQEVEARYKHAALLAEHARQDRNALILVAIKDGYSHGWISDVTGLSRGRIAQIAKTA